MNDKKRELEAWEKTECADLKKALHDYNARQSKLGRLTQDRIAADLDMSQGAVSGYLNGRLALNLNIATYFSEKLRIPIRNFSLRLADEAERVARAGSGNVEPAILGARRKAPLISYVSAGLWNEACDPYSVGDAEDWFDAPSNASPSAFWLRVLGDSMTAPSGPSVPEGHFILVDPEVHAENGSLVVAKLLDSNEVTFKKLVIDAGRKYLKPLNPSYRTIEINGECRIVGVVTEAVIKFR